MHCFDVISSHLETTFKAFGVVVGVFENQVYDKLFNFVELLLCLVAFYVNLAAKSVKEMWLSISNEFVFEFIENVVVMVEKCLATEQNDFSLDQLK